MTIFTRAMSVTGCVVAASTVMSAQSGSRPVRTGPDSEVRHLVYIATPGDNGTDNQSGVVVLDADKGYSFIKRIPYGLPASQDARSEDRRASKPACRCRCSTSRPTVTCWRSI